MNRLFASGLLVVGLTAGCAAETAPEKRSELQLMVKTKTFPYNPLEAGEKGSGDLGQAERQLQVGERVLADCISRPEAYVEDKYDKADAIRVKGGEFAGMLVPLQVYVPVKGMEQVRAEATPVFNFNPDKIRDKLDFC